MMLPVNIALIASIPMTKITIKLSLTHMSHRYCRRDMHFRNLLRYEQQRISRSHTRGTRAEELQTSTATLTTNSGSMDTHKELIYWSQNMND
jgi:hypothetical protein